MKLGHLIFCIVFITATPSFADSAQDTFFQHFISNIHQQNPALSELYADNATISRILSSHGYIEEIVNFDGARYKKMIKNGQGKNLLTADSDFSAVDFFTNGSRIAIKADRYSRSKCFTDSSYFIVIDKQENGGYKIINERIEKPMQNYCKKTPALIVKAKPTIKAASTVKPAPLHLQRTDFVKIAKQEAAAPDSHASLNQAAKSFEQSRPYNLAHEIQIIANSIKHKLPMDVDKNTQLTSYDYNKAQLTYNYKMPKYSSKPDFDHLLEGVVKPNLSRQFCSDKNTKDMLDHGGTINHNYSDKSNTPLFSFTLTKNSCTKLEEQSAKNSQ